MYDIAILLAVSRDQKVKRADWFTDLSCGNEKRGAFFKEIDKNKRKKKTEKNNNNDKIWGRNPVDMADARMCSL